MKTPVFESFQKNTCKITKTMLTYRQQKKAMKETLIFRRRQEYSVTD